MCQYSGVVPESANSANDIVPRLTLAIPLEERSHAGGDEGIQVTINLSEHKGDKEPEMLFQSISAKF